jgi:hypothetical protein
LADLHSARQAVFPKIRLEFLTWFKWISRVDSREMTQAVNFRPFTPKDHVRTRFSVCGICSVKEILAQTSSGFTKLRKAIID